MARIRVEKVESSVKGGVVAQLGQKTLILGRNKRGKSAIVNSVELAGTGAASDVAGRSLLAKDADLFMLAPPGAEKVWSQVRFKGAPEGSSLAAWELSKGHRAKRTGPTIAFPLRDVQAALLGSPETARKWILEVGGSFDWSEVLALVPKSLHGKLGGLFSNPEDGSTSGALSFCAEESKRRLRELNATAKAARSLSAPAQPPPSDQDFTALETVIAAWKAIEAAGGAEPSNTALEAITLARNSCQLWVDSLIAQGQDLERQLASLPPPGGSLEIRNAAVLVIEAFVRAKVASCGICGGGVNQLDLAARAARGREKIAESVKAEGERASLTVAHRGLLADLGAVRRELGRLETEVARAEAKEKEKGVAEVAPPELDLASAEARLRELHSLRAGWEAAKRSEEQALTAEREATEWTQLGTALSSALGTLVEKARVGFEAKVQRFLPRADLFGVELLDGEREILRVGLRRLSGDRMVLHSALSGAEWATVTAALALATAPEGPSPCVVCPEERAFDPETLTEVLDAFDRALGAGSSDPSEADPNSPQVIITSPVAPSQIPSGWTVILLKDGEVTESMRTEASSAVEAPASKGRKKGKKMEREEEKPAPTAQVISSFIVKDGKLVEDPEEQKKRISSLFD